MTVQTIFSLPLSKLTNIHAALDATFLTQLIQQLPQIGTETDKYYLLNNSLTLANENNLEHINIYNNFVQYSQRKCQLIQLIKEQNV